jgi:hypothetical protein
VTVGASCRSFGCAAAVRRSDDKFLGLCINPCPKIRTWGTRSVPCCAFPMQVTVEIPDQFVRLLVPSGRDASRTLFLQQHEIYDYSVDDLEKDLVTLDRVLLLI